MCVLGYRWAKHYYHLSKNEIYKYGLLGIFFSRIFGTDWLETEQTMTQEERRLLLIDLCGRLPYGVMVRFEGWSPEKLSEVDLDEDVYNGMGGLPLPYLRPMSSMTEEEKYTYRHMLGATLNSEGKSIMFVYVEDFPTVIDWLNAHHFDYRDLIEKGLALEAPKGMYIC